MIYFNLLIHFMAELKSDLVSHALCLSRSSTVSAVSLWKYKAGRRMHSCVSIEILESPSKVELREMVTQIKVNWLENLSEETEITHHPVQVLPARRPRLL